MAYKLISQAPSKPNCGLAVDEDTGKLWLVEIINGVIVPIILITKS